jgi:acid phosphatase (class A)
MKGSRLFRRFQIFVACSLVAVALATNLLAEERYLDAKKIDGIALLSPPPAPDSPEQAADLASVRAVFKARTPEEKRGAEKSSTLSIYNFAPVIGGFFQEGKFPKVDALMENVKTSSTPAINAPKEHWNRPRPYQIDPELTLGKPERNASYPSGHSTRGTVQALVLAELFPEKREEILEFGRKIGWDRVLIGKHFPTDVYAGRVLGQAIVREMMKNPAFQHDLAEAKAEVQTAVAEPAIAR